jgi:hypothetical protein
MVDKRDLGQSLAFEVGKAHSPKSGGLRGLILNAEFE